MCFIRIRPENAPLNPPGAAPTLMTVEQEQQYFAPPSQPGLDSSLSFSPSFPPGSYSGAKPGTLAPSPANAVSASSSSPSNSLSKPSTTGPQSPLIGPPTLTTQNPFTADYPSKKAKKPSFRRKTRKESHALAEGGVRKGSTTTEQKVQEGINESLGVGALVVGKDTLGEPVGRDGEVNLGIGVREDHIRRKGAPTFVGVEEEEMVEKETGGGMNVAKEAIGVAF